MQKIVEYEFILSRDQWNFIWTKIRRKEEENFFQNWNLEIVKCRIYGTEEAERGKNDVQLKMTWLHVEQRAREKRINIWFGIPVFERLNNPRMREREREEKRKVLIGWKLPSGSPLEN